MQDKDKDSTKTASEETGDNDLQAAFPRNNRHGDRNRIADQKTAVKASKSPRPQWTGKAATSANRFRPLFRGESR